jgi:hypothetical protein
MMDIKINDKIMFCLKNRKETFKGIVTNSNTLNFNWYITVELENGNYLTFREDSLEWFEITGTLE